MNNQELRDRILSCEEEFIQLIKKRLGIIIRNQNVDLMHSILSACHKFHCNPREYLNRLVNCPDNSPLLEHLVADITVGETYFFRDKHQMQLLRYTLLPRLIKEKREKNTLSLRVWSAGVSTGEEIYTIALLLRELLPDINRWAIHLLGTDLNTNALKKAKIGIYSKWSMRSISSYYRQQYFSEKNNQFHLLPLIKDMVDFRYLNLNDNTYPSILNGTNSQDLILCRNVLIYFSKESIGRLLKKMYESLAEGGNLLLGASDPVFITGTGLVLHPNEGMVFSRNDAIEEPVFSPPLIKQLAPQEASVLTTACISSSDIICLLDKASWQEALSLINTADTSRIKRDFLLNAKAQALANLGQLYDAVQCCEESLILNSTHKEYYFLYALILIELDRLDEAETALRKVLFLDRTYVEGHFQLGLLLIRNEKIEAGLKSLYNALTLVESKDPSSQVEGSKDLSYGRFSEILRSEIELAAGSAR